MSSGPEPRARNVYPYSLSPPPLPARAQSAPTPGKAPNHKVVVGSLLPPCILRVPSRLVAVNIPPELVP